VSVGKHANYRTQSVCNTSFDDSCSSPRDLMATFLKPAELPGVPFGAGQNLGESYAQFSGGLYTPIYDAMVGTNNFEYFWVAGNFCGWLGVPPITIIDMCAESYQKALFAYGY